MNRHPETKLIIIDTEGSWEYEFNQVPFYRIVNGDVSITEKVIGQKLNGNNFYKKAYQIKELVKQDVINLIASKKPVLFIVELEEPEEIGYFSAFVIEHVYNLQRIRRKYWKNNLKHSYFIVLEECENVFSSHSLGKKQLSKLRKKYNELANLQIGILSSSQRLTEVDKKFRAKMSGYLIGHILPEDFIGTIQRALRLHLGKQAKKVTAPEFRYNFYYTGLNESFKIQPFKQKSAPFEVPRTRREHKPIRVHQIPEHQNTHKKKCSIIQKINELFSFFLADYHLENYPRTSRKFKAQYKEKLNEQEKDNELLATDDEEFDETLMM